MTAIITPRSRRKLGHEPAGIDLTPIVSHPYTSEEEQEISAFFQQLKAQNAKDPEITALLEKVARRHGK